MGDVKGKRVLVTGGAGFLGCHFVRQALDSESEAVIVLDALTYAGDERRLDFAANDPRFRLFRVDVADAQAVDESLSEVRPQNVIHFAADSHVTRSESDPERFYRTNVEGTRVLLDTSIAKGVERFVHISTDEIYGPITEGSYREEDKSEGDSQASSAYARSKSLADDLARSYKERLDVVIARPTNAFGPWQYPEKAFARWITRALRGESLYVWGDGLYVRQWLHADDFARAIRLLVANGSAGEVYNVGPEHDPEIKNLELAQWIVDYLGLPRDRIELTTYDRPEHDRRYAVDASKMRALEWHPGDVWQQFAETVEWYRGHQAWWKSHIEEAESIYTDSKA